MSEPFHPDLSPDDPNPSPSPSPSNEPVPPTVQPFASNPMSPTSPQQPPMYTGSPAYPPYPPYPYGPPQRTNGLAIASMVLGILWIYWIGSILALIFGYVARQQIRERHNSGGGMATAGIVLGWVGVGVLGVILVIALISYSLSP
ncbi:DUF4190 domain-containing protein [Streptomyces phytophilus]|uniref:DUF4190 domain-containing protein n=1 Tax=Streptomyces phytophilus TaxID=722715 RepID=UPI0015F0C0BC|nr:DUF4190 domain-containing protein [Streptomyces phytophilus]